MSELVETSHEKAERAYAVYASEGRADIEKTPQLCGIPVRTVYYYRSRDHWDGRLELEHGFDADEQVSVAARLIKDGMPRVAERLLWIATGEKPLVNKHGELQSYSDGRSIMVPAASERNAIMAARWLLQYGMMSAAEILRGEPAPMDPVFPAMSAGEAHPPPSAHQQASDILIANYQAANTRRTPGKRR